LCFPCPSDLPRNVSRYATRGLPVWAWTQTRAPAGDHDLECRPPARGSASAPARRCTHDGTWNPLRAAVQTPSTACPLPPLLHFDGHVITGSGNGIFGSTRPLSFVESVSLVWVSRSLARTPMSPECSSGTSMRSFRYSRRDGSASRQPRGSVPDFLAVLHLAGEDPEQRHVPDMRFGDRLKHLRARGPVCRSSASAARRCPILRFDRGRPGRGHSSTSLLSNARMP